MDERKTLYQDFLKDKRIYNLNVSYWRVKLQKTLDQKILSKDQLIKNKDAKGKNYYDGNPIFSFYSISNEKAIRIIQEDVDSTLSWTDIKLIEAWIDKIIIVSNEQEKEVLELVVSLYLTKTSVDKCLELVKKWLNGDLNSSNIDTELIEFDNTYSFDYFPNEIKIPSNYNINLTKTQRMVLRFIDERDRVSLNDIEKIVPKVSLVALKKTLLILTKAKLIKEIKRKEEIIYVSSKYRK